ncbi:MAG: hypothetical protein DWQ10_15505 [Calditrichaeota bacterium]|nr:MAG: hypothetical protein DWQ10_15505 [Calditrichota bacterium]
MKTLTFILSLSLVLAFGCSKDEHEGHSHNGEEMQTMAKESGEMEMHQHAEMHADSLYTCPMHKDFVTSDGNTKCPQCKMALKSVSEVNPEFDAASVELHACPMHSDFVTTDKDGMCPICKAKISDM